jgi:ADP-dependent phosphofructokinase/glucokinase
MGERIALGLGNNVDYEIVWESRVFEELIEHYAIRAAELNTSTPIESERDLVVSILGFLQQGCGGERAVASSAIVEHFAQRFERKVSLGGTSVRAAIAMRKLGFTSVLHLVTINDEVRRLLPPDCPWICSNTQESLFPHLIVQFDRDATIEAGDIALHSRRANRLIYHDDLDNVAMRLNEEFGEQITDAHIFLISGFNAMRSEALLADRLDTLERMMDRLPSTAHVFYEDGGFYNPDFSRLIHERLDHRIGIYSLNEDELQAHAGRSIDLLDAEEVGRALQELHKRSPVPTLVVHTMEWALAWGKEARSFRAALHGGVSMATTRYRHGDAYGAEEYHATAALPANPSGARFAHEVEQRWGSQACCVAVPQVEQKNGTTIGLGDAFVGGFLPALLPDGA